MMEKRMRRRCLCLLCCLLLLAANAASAIVYQTLRPETQGPEVIAMQRALHSLGYPLTPDGKYGQMTTQAVRAFQQAQRLTADGLAGNKTLTALYALAPAFAPGPATPTDPPAAVPTVAPSGRYEMGSYGSAVADLQVRLTALGYVCGRTDGVFDNQTRAAVVSFQQANRLSADGIAGAQTLARLYAADAIPASGTPRPPEPTAAPTVFPTATAAPTLAPAPTAAVFSRLQLGSRGADVLRLQQKLRDMGFLAGNADGVFGRMTQDAVIKFQRANLLTADGIAGTKTLARLYAIDPPTATPSPTAPTTNSPTPIPTQNSPAPSSAWAVVSTANGGALNFRSSPETRSNNLIAGLAVGTRVEVLSNAGVWSTIRYNGREGYVMSSFLKAAAAPTVSPTVTPDPTVAPTAIPDTPAPSAEPTPSPTIAPTEAPPFPRILRGGDTGEDVSKLQQELKTLKYTVYVTGVYDAETTKAVERFQTLNALKADGVFGSQSAQVLLSGNARRADEEPLAYQTLRIDNTDGGGSAIRLMQERLKALGYRVSVNGTFDILTHEAVVGFQRRNGLTVSGVADALMQARLFTDNAKDASVSVEDPGADEGKGGGPSSGSVRLLHWYNDIKPSVSSGQQVTVYDPGSGIQFTIRFYSMGHHADSEPATLRDTLLMNRAFGMPSWDIHTVYVKLPSGVWTLASMHNRPHLSGAVNNNGFGGHLCIHFLRDLDETQQSDPNYGMANQRAIRSAWKSLTGEVVE